MNITEDSFSAHLNNASKKVSQWPLWKQTLLGGKPVKSITEEQVRDVLEKWGDLGFEITDTLFPGGQFIQFRIRSAGGLLIGYEVQRGHIRYSSPQGSDREWIECTPEQFEDKWGRARKLNGALLDIETLLNPSTNQSPEPSLESQIAEQQRVIEGLREDIEGLESAAITGQGRINLLDDQVKDLTAERDRLKSENESLLDKFGPIDEAECKAAASVTELAGLVAKQADIQDEIFQMIPELMRNIAIEVVQKTGRANRVPYEDQPALKINTEALS